MPNTKCGKSQNLKMKINAVNCIQSKIVNILNKYVKLSKDGLSEPDEGIIYIYIYLYMCVYVYVCVCVCICVYVCVCVCAFACKSIHG